MGSFILAVITVLILAKLFPDKRPPGSRRDMWGNRY